MKTQTANTKRPAPPEELDGEALLEWDRICSELASLDRLDKADRAILTLYCETWSTHRAAMRGVNKHGSVIRYPNKTTGPSPFYKVMKETAVILRGLLTDMGLTPTTRGISDEAAGDLEI